MEHGGRIFKAVEGWIIIFNFQIIDEEKAKKIKRNFVIRPGLSTFADCIRLIFPDTFGILVEDVDVSTVKNAAVLLRISNFEGVEDVKPAIRKVRIEIF